MSREKFRTRLGFILVSAGCAIGIGNVWKFPYIAGENGGGVFVLFYLLFLIIMGIPVLTMEFATGRASRQSTVNAFRTLEKPNHKWHLHGYVSLAGCILLMMYYTTVSGWMLGYFFRFASGTFEKNAKPATVFSDMLADHAEMILWMGITVIIGVAVCSTGLQKGTERISKIIMTGMLILTAALAVNSLTLDGASEGLRFFLMPDFGKAIEKGIGNVMTAAMSQAFFSLSIGLASMEIFGSYMSKDNTLLSESVRICVLDTFVAVVSGIIIFPACFTFGIEPDSGPPLIFITLPKVFSGMANGRILGSLFFLFMSFASLSTVIAVCENLISAGIDSFGLGRKKASVICGILLFTLSLPCIFGYNILNDIKIIGGRNISDSEDFIVSNLLLPAGALVYILFCTTKYGWGFDKYIKEANTGKGLKISQKTKPYFQFILPVLILIIFISSLR